MTITPLKNGPGLAKTRPPLLISRPIVLQAASDLRRALAKGPLTTDSWSLETTAAFSSLFKCDAAMIVHENRHFYYSLNARIGIERLRNFTSRSIGWDRMDGLFAPEIMETREMIGDGFVMRPAPAGLIVPNVNSDRILVFGADGQKDTFANSNRVNDLILDRVYQQKGSILITPIITGTAENAKRALAYLYSPNPRQFEDVDMAGPASLALASVSATILKAFLK